MNRREFLKAGVLGGGLLATASLPAVERPKWNPGMSMGFVSLPLGATKPFTVLHISDTHLTASLPSDPENVRKFLATRFVGQDPENALRVSIAWAQKMKCDYILHTGDLIDCASDGNVALLKKYFGAGPNMLYAPGNHEYGTTAGGPTPQQTEAEFRAINTAKVQGASPVDLLFHAQVVNGVNFVMIDDVYSTVPASTVEKFHAEAKKGLPIVLCQHVPFFAPEIGLAHVRIHESGLALDEQIVPHPSRDFSRQAEDRTTADFIRYLKSEPLLKAILAGHYHCSMQGRFSPTATEYVVGANFRYCAEEIFIY